MCYNRVMKDTRVILRVTNGVKKWLTKLGHGKASSGLTRCIEYRHICHIYGVDDVKKLQEILDKARDAGDLPHWIDTIE
jgi:hypothetical protein